MGKPVHNHVHQVVKALESSEVFFLSDTPEQKIQYIISKFKTTPIFKFDLEDLPKTGDDTPRYLYNLPYKSTVFEFQEKDKVFVILVDDHRGLGIKYSGCEITHSSVIFLLIDGDPEWKGVGTCSFNAQSKDEHIMVSVRSLSSEAEDELENPKDVHNWVTIMQQWAIHEILCFLVFLNCANIDMREVKAPVKLNKKRIAKGKTPLFSHWELDLEAHYPGERGAACGGTHASPRRHLRRGHFRHLHTGKTIWIAAHSVGKGPGFVSKDYVKRGNL